MFKMFRVVGFLVVYRTHGRRFSCMDTPSLLKRASQLIMAQANGYICKCTVGVYSSKIIYSCSMKFWKQMKWIIFLNGFVNDVLTCHA